MMKRMCPLFAALAALTVNANLQTPWIPVPLSQPDPARDDRIEWHRDARFGCFIHWGAYSGLGNEFHGRQGWLYSEHIMRALPIPRETYLQEVARPFNPVGFNADEWVRLMRDAGMRYIVITAKHHDGFAMYPSQASSFDIADLTAFDRDPLAELKAACDRHGLRFGVYYSHAFDWEHPFAPGNDWDYDNPAGDKRLWGTAWWEENPSLLNKVRRYVDEKAIPQILELIHQYHPDLIWGDTPDKLPLEEELRILAAIRAADPHVVVNSRLAPGYGDYQSTHDRAVHVRHTPGHWEAIPTTNESYAYSKFDKSHKPVSLFIRLLAQCVANDGNMLLNVGPRGDGCIDQPDVAILRGIGDWMSTYGDSIHGCGRSPLPPQGWGVTTIKGNRLFLHVFNWPENGRLLVAGLQTDPVRVAALSDPAVPLPYARTGVEDVVVDVGPMAPDPVDSVIAMDFSGPPEASRRIRISNAGEATWLHVFDGELNGPGIHYGDGKQDNDVLRQWSDLDGCISWPIRVVGEGYYKVTLVYSTDTVNDVGTFRISAGDQQLASKVIGTAGPGIFREDPIGLLYLKGQADRLTITPETIGATNLMRLKGVKIQSRNSPY